MIAVLEDDSDDQDYHVNADRGGTTDGNEMPCLLLCPFIFRQLPSYVSKWMHGQCGGVCVKAWTTNSRELDPPNCLRQLRARCHTSE